MYFYLDESGDLGTSAASSRHFVMALLAVPDAKTNVALARIFKRLRERRLKKSLRKMPEFKATKTPPHLREAVLKGIARLPVSLFALTLSKPLPASIRSVEDIYNRMAGRLLFKAIVSRKRKQLQIIIDRRSTKKQLRKTFDEYLMTHLADELPRTFFSPSQVHISHLDSQKCFQLQAVDFVAWSFLQAYDRGVLAYREIICQRIVMDRIIKSV